MLAASKHGISLTSRPENDPNQRQAWLGPGSGPRFKTAADREAAQRVRDVTLATGRAPDAVTLQKILGVMSPTCGLSSDPSLLFAETIELHIPSACWAQVLMSSAAQMYFVPSRNV